MSSAAGRPWEGIDLWASHKQFRQTLSDVEEAEFDDYLDEARPVDLEERRSDLEEEFPDIDLDEPIPDELFHTLPDEDLSRLVNWQYDKDILDEERERAASAKEFAETMAEIADAEAPPTERDDHDDRPEFGPPPPLTAKERFEIGFATKGTTTPEMRAWEIAADRALSEQFGQQVVGQWVFGMSDPMLLSAGEELPEGAEVIGPAGADYPGGKMIRIPTARRKYRIAEDGTFLGQFAYDDRQAASLLYVTFYQNAGTYNLPTSYGVLVDVSTDRIFNVSTSRAPKDVMEVVRADNDGGLWIDNDGSKPDPRWIAAEPKTVDESMESMAQRLAPKGLVAEWVTDPDHILNPTARANRRGLFRPVEEQQAGMPTDAVPDDAPEGGTEPDDEGTTVEEVFGPPPQHLQDLDNIPEGTPPTVDWGDAAPQWDDVGGDVDVPAERIPVGAETSIGESFVSGRTLTIVGIAVVVMGAVLIAWLMGGSDAPDDAAAPANDVTPPATAGEQPALPTDLPPTDDGAPDDVAPEQPAPATAARTPDGQVPELPSGWAAPPAFDTFDTDVADPMIRYSSGGSLWAWSVWAESELISEQTETEADFSVTQIARIPLGTAIPAEFVIDVDCSDTSCRYSTVYDEVTISLALSGLTLTGDYELPPDDSQLDVCEATGTYELEVTDLTVINNRLVPDYIRGTRTLTQECGEYELREVIEIAGRYLFRGSYADQ